MKMELKLKKRHPNKAFRLGRHVITPIFAKYDLNKEEVKELARKGCQAWVMVKEDKKKKDDK